MLFDGKKFYYAVVQRDGKVDWARAFPTKDTRDTWVELGPHRHAVTAVQIGPERAKLARLAVDKVIVEQAKHLKLAHDYAEKFNYKEAFHKTENESYANRLIEKIEAQGIKLTDKQKSQLFVGKNNPA